MIKSALVNYITQWMETSGYTRRWIEWWFTGNKFLGKVCVFMTSCSEVSWCNTYSPTIMHHWTVIIGKFGKSVEGSKLIQSGSLYIFLKDTENKNVIDNIKSSKAYYSQLSASTILFWSMYVTWASKRSKTSYKIKQEWTNFVFVNGTHKRFI